jgi:hypothetical protein
MLLRDSLLSLLDGSTMQTWISICKVIRQNDTETFITHRLSLTSVPNGFHVDHIENAKKDEGVFRLVVRIVNPDQKEHC